MRYKGTTRSIWPLVIAVVVIVVVIAAIYLLYLAPR